jgi:hypothetical protein
MEITMMFLVYHGPVVSMRFRHFAGSKLASATETVKARNASVRLVIWFRPRSAVLISRLKTLLADLL